MGRKGDYVWGKKKERKLMLRKLFIFCMTLYMFCLPPTLQYMVNFSRFFPHVLMGNCKENRHKCFKTWLTVLQMITIKWKFLLICESLIWTRAWKNANVSATANNRDFHYCIQLMLKMHRKWHPFKHIHSSNFAMLYTFNLRGKHVCVTKWLCNC